MPPKKEHKVSAVKLDELAVYFVIKGDVDLLSPFRKQSGRENRILERYIDLVQP